jgi:acyl carrier protein
MTSGTDSPAIATPAVELALSILFGDENVADLDRSLVQSLVERRAAWVGVIKAVWAAGVPGLSALGPGPALPVAPAPIVAPAPAPVVAPAPAPVVAPAAASNGAPAAPQPDPLPASNGTAHSPGVELFDPTAAEPSATGSVRSEPVAYEEVRDELVALLEDLTGYPAEVLEDDADLEADLAIDSVKQVEAFAKLREHYELTMEDNFAIRDYRTIRSSATYLANRLNSERVAEAVAP